MNNTGQLLKQIGQQQALFGAGELWHFIGLIKRRTSSSIARIERKKGLL